MCTRRPQVTGPLVQDVECHVPVPGDRALEADRDEVPSDPRVVAQGLEGPVERSVCSPLRTDSELVLRPSGDPGQRKQLCGEVDELPCTFGAGVLPGGEPI